MIDYSTPLNPLRKWHTTDVSAEARAAAEEYRSTHPEPTYYRDEPLGWLLKR